LKFNRSFEKLIRAWSLVMEHNGMVKAGVALHDAPLHRRFLNKLVDILPATLTSLIGGLLVTQYQFNHSETLHPVAVQAAPASAEMIQLVRDEHGAIMNYLNGQIAAEKARNSAADAADVRAAADAKAASDKAAADKLAAEVLAATSKPAPVAASVPAVVVTAKAATSRKVIAVAAAAPAHEPLVVAQAAPAAPVAPVAQPAPEQQPKSLLDKTLDIKDHVVAATSHAAWSAVSAIGSLPSWIASMGDHGDDTNQAPSSGGQSFTSLSRQASL
jgi:hypothetical protein